MARAMKEIFLNEGIKVKEAQTCFLTGGGSDVVFQGMKDGFFGVPGIWSVRRSRETPLMWLDPRPEMEDNSKLYAHEDYPTHMTSSLSYQRGLKGLRFKVSGMILSVIGRYPGNLFEKILGTVFAIFLPFTLSANKTVFWLKGPVGKLLEIGCGSGKNLKKLEQMGWEVEGVEYDPVSVESARSLGLKVFNGSIESAPFKGGTFDAILMVHVFEHLQDPITSLRRCQEVLTPGGRLHLLTPNIRSLGYSRFKKFWRALDVPRHLFLYSPESLKLCLEQVGFRVIRNRTSAREARGTWRESDLKRRDPEAKVPDGRTSHYGFREKFFSQLFAWWEGLLCIFLPVGEEIVITAVKPDSK